MAYIFSALLINMQYVNRVSGKIVFSYRNFLCTAGNKGFGNFFMLILSEERLVFHREHYTSFALASVSNVDDVQSA